MTMSMEGFAMLAAVAQGGSPVEVLRTGAFLDMHHREVVIDAAFLDGLIENFEAGTAGQEIPIDVDHEKGDAAGWIRRIWREDERLYAEIEWNSLGEQLVGDRVYRYVSAFLDVANQVLRSVSLVNFPAVKGLAPVELSEELVGFKDVPVREILRARMHAQFVNAIDALAQDGVLDADMREAALASVETAVEAFYQAISGVSATTWRPDDADVYFRVNAGMEEGRMFEEALREQIRAELEAELREQQQTEVELREQIRAEMREQVEAELERHQQLVAFAEEVTGGDVALTVPADEVVAFLAALPEEQVETAMSLLRGKLVELGERGSSARGRSEETALLQPLPDEYAAKLRAGELELSDLGDPILGLGDLDQYDLSEFKS
jgi:phage I-like protein